MDAGFITAAAPFVIGLIGVATGYGGIWFQVKSNKVRIKNLENNLDELTGNPASEPAFIRRIECVSQNAERTTEIKELKNELKRLTNFARWILTEKHKLSLKEVNEVLGNE